VSASRLTWLQVLILNVKLFRGIDGLQENQRVTNRKKPKEPKEAGLNMTIA
jgi:hypothetical protein